MKSKTTTLLTLFFILLAAIAACKQTAPRAASLQVPVVALVNNAEITEDDLGLFMEGRHGVREMPDARTQMIDELINQELLYQQGLKLGLDRDPGYRNQVRIMEMRLREFKRAELARQLASTRIAASVNITGDDVRQYYVQNEPAITTDLRLQVLRFRTEQDAQAAHEQLQAGIPFETLVHQVNSVSSPPGAATDTGFLHWNQIPAEWAEPLFNLSRGQVSGVLQSARMGSCIAMLVDRKTNPDASLERMSASIMNRLRDIRIQEAYDRYLAQLHKEAKVVKIEERRKGP